MTLPIQEQIKELNSQGKTVYSISKLDLANECLFAYYNRYILKKQGKDNIYNLTGETLHESIEKICKKQKVNPQEELDHILSICDILDIHFPTEYSKIRWTNNIECFLKDFRLPNWNMETEKWLLFQLLDIWIQVKIDLIIKNSDDTYDILDWKSSSKFNKEDMLKKGRQLVLYKLAFENVTGKKVNRVCWFMLKYLNVCYKLKNGKIKTKMCERAYWVDECANMLITDLKKIKDENGNSIYDELDIEFFLKDAKENNNLNNMPQEIKDKYSLEPCIIYYDVTDELIEECKNYIQTTVKKIESIPTDKPELWIPREINNKTKFFCQNLSSYRYECRYLDEFLENQNEDEEINDEDIEDILS